MNNTTTRCVKLVLLFIMAGVIPLTAQNKPYLSNLSDYIENLAVFETNQEPGRCYYIPETHVSLNGSWKFFWGSTPQEIPATFYETDFNDANWDVIQVPSNWEMLGYGDKMFRNVNAPFKVNVPFVPKDYNPTGAYRKTFVLPDDWNGKQVFLRMEKVASASFVWINGREVGYNEGAQEPAEFNITPYLKPGENQIAIHVVKFSDGFYLEGQDYWRLAGIFDDILLYSSPDNRIYDWQIITDLDDKYVDSELCVNVDVKNYAGKAGAMRLKGEVWLQDKLVGTLKSKDFTLGSETTKQIMLKHNFKNPLKWTAETPNLYKLKLFLYSNNNLLDKVDADFGFKETQIVNGTFCLNGVPVKVNAVNTHMQHPTLGHVMTEEVIRKDLELIKQFNFNAVRISHYPPVNKYLELANEYGLYIIDEVGDEAHATEWVSNDSRFTEMYRDRVRKMVLRDRNYPCILFWSAGNESGEGVNISEVVKEGKRLDATRSWMYGGNGFSHVAEDIIGPRYPVPIELEIQEGLGMDNDSRPSFLDEYISVAGNGCGALDDYWRVIRSHPRTMGGAIWDFVSPGLEEKVRRLTDLSPSHTPAHIMGNVKLTDAKYGKALNLSGFDSWVEVYRNDNLEISGSQLVLTCDVYPRKLVSECGSFITKGSRQFGLQQAGKDKLKFYLYTDSVHQVLADLPADWEYNWHNITGTYDGKEMCLYIDGELCTSKQVSGNIRNLPFPLNIGRNAEIHTCETNVPICDAMIDNVGVFDRYYSTNDLHPQNAALWLDFEEEKEYGTFFSNGIGARTYGCIWPDRKPQPEMWQMKKTGQPIAVALLDERDFTVEIWNRNHFTSSEQYEIEWALTQDCEKIQKGYVDECVAPGAKKMVKLPIVPPAIVPGKEYRLEFTVKLKKEEVWAPKGYVVAWEQLELPWKRIESLPQPASKGRLELVDNDTVLQVGGTAFAYKFSKMTGELISIRIDEKEVLNKPLRLNVWRAPLANELDDWTVWSENRNGWKREYGMKTVTEQYSHGMHDLVNVLASFDVSQAEGKVIVRVRSYMLNRDQEKVQRDKYISGVQANGFENIYNYEIYPDGRVAIAHTVLPQGRLPQWLMRIGLSTEIADDFKSISWYGRGPEENYPDRKSGYPVGIYKSDVDDMFEPYLIPQDCGLRTDNRWIKLCDSHGKGLQIGMDEWFNFNAYPYSTDNLTKANYMYQLEKINGYTLNLDYATSGVGCTARSILLPYKVPVTQYERKIDIVLLR